MRRSKRGTAAVRVGAVSDTHGLVRPAVLAALAAVAPVAAIRGNNDVGAWARVLPETRVVEAGDARLFVLHAIADLDRDAAAGGFAAVISGHSHRPSIERRDGVLFVNPGSAGPRRFKLPIAVARLTVSAGGAVDGEVITLDA